MSPNVAAAMREWKSPAAFLPEWAMDRAAKIVEAKVGQSPLYALPLALRCRLICEIAEALAEVGA